MALSVFMTTATQMGGTRNKGEENFKHPPRGCKIKSEEFGGKSSRIKQQKVRICFYLNWGGGGRGLGKGTKFILAAKDLYRATELKSMEGDRSRVNGAKCLLKGRPV